MGSCNGVSPTLCHGISTGSCPAAILAAAVLALAPACCSAADDDDGDESAAALPRAPSLGTVTILVHVTILGKGTRSISANLR